MAPPPRTNPIDGDVLAEILLRLPPGEPEHLFRAALVCKPWLRVICLPAFRTQYRAFHGAPPLLGLLYRNQVCDGDPAPRFASTTSVPGFPHPGSHGRPLDCRHGRVLLHMFHDSAVDLLVWDPVTGDRRVVPEPGIDWLVYTAAVFCAAAGCDHLDCHGGPFRVLFLATDDRQEVVKASVYSSATDAWSPPVSLDDSCECYARHKRDATAETMFFSSYIPYVQPRRVAAIGDAVYFTISRSAAIAKYDWGENRLSVIDPPPPNTEVYGGFVSLMVMEDDSLGLAGVDDSTSSLHLWSRTVKGAAKWVQCRVIDLEKVMPMTNPREGDGAYVVGFAEGVGVIFVRTDAGLFTLELKSGLVKKVDEFGVYFSVLPYMSFYTPDRGRLLSLARLTDV